MRILHVLGMMGRGGIETWLMNVMRCIDRDHFRFDFLVSTDRPQDHDEEIRRLGGRIFGGPSPAQPLAYRRRLLRVLRDEGPYDVVHAHGENFMGFVLHHARRAGVPVRIAHSHNLYVKHGKRLRSHLFDLINRRRMFRSLTVGLGCSQLALTSLFGRSAQNDPHFGVLLYGMDFEPLRPRSDRRDVMAEFGIPDDAAVVGTVGRLTEQKNYRLFLDIAAAVAEKRPDVRFLAVGGGPQEQEIRRWIAEGGLQDRVVLAGSRSDVPRLLAAMDVFLFPTAWEGLGLVVVEAQAAGLRCLISDRVPREAVVLGDHVQVLPLEAGPQGWGRALCDMLDAPAVDRQATWRRMTESRFSIGRSVADLVSVYETNRPPAAGRGTAGQAGGAVR